MTPPSVRRLDTIRGLRRRQEEAARQDLSRALAAVRSAEAAFRTADLAARAPFDGATGSDFQIAHRLFELRGDARRIAKEQCVLAESAARSAASVWEARRSEVERIERLRARRLAEAELEGQRRNQRELDDLVGSRHRRRSSR